MKRTIGLIFQAIIVAYLIIFAVNNTQSIQVKFFIGAPIYNFPLFLLVIIVLFIGFAIGVFIMFLSKFSLRSQIKKLNKQLNEYQTEIARLKNITISGSDSASINQNDKAAPTGNIDSNIKNILR